MGAGTSTTGRLGTSVVLALLWTAWLLLPAYLVLAGMGELLSFFGEVPTDADRESARRSFLTAGAAAAGIPLLGAAVAACTRRTRSASVFGVAAVAGLLGAVLLVVATAPPEPRSAIPVDRGGGPCQEHSGGDNRCPGG